MSQAHEEFRTRIVRRAVQMEIGGFRPPEAPTASWFGRVLLAGPGESWPTAPNGKPLHALCQINLTELPFRPPRLEDLAFLTVFIAGDDDLPDDSPNGSDWCLRAYRTLEELVPLSTVPTSSAIQSFPMRPSVVEADYPCWDDVPCDVPEEMHDGYFDLFDTTPGLKLGGWPSLIQSEIYWAPFNKHPIAPEYVFQIDSTEKGNWMWGDAGVGYFGRGTAPGRTDEWALAWQCY